MSSCLVRLAGASFSTAYTPFHIFATLQDV